MQIASSAFLQPAGKGRVQCTRARARGRERAVETHCGANHPRRIWDLDNVLEPEVAVAVVTVEEPLVGSLEYLAAECAFRAVKNHHHGEPWGGWEHPVSHHKVEVRVSLQQRCDRPNPGCHVGDHFLVCIDPGPEQLERWPGCGSLDLVLRHQAQQKHGFDR